MDVKLADGKLIPAKSPRTKAGLYAATTDKDEVSKWWSMWPDSLVGIPAGVNGLVFLDLDEKNGKSGEASLFEHGLDVPDTVTYSTPSGGRHWIYRAPANVPMNGVADYRGYAGLDRRAGASYAVFWSGVPLPSEWILTEAPEWLCDPAIEDGKSGSYSGDVETWLENHRGEPSPLLKHIAAEDFEQPGEGAFMHDLTLRLIIRIVSLAAAGEPGGTSTLDLLAERYLAEGFEHYEDEWNGMVEWAIKNCGGSILPADIPAFMDVLGRLGEDFPPELLSGEVTALIDECIRRGLTDAEIFSLSSNNREIDPDDLWLAIELARDNGVETAPQVSESVTTELDPTPEPRHEVRILSPEDRKRAQKHYRAMWTGEYEEWARSQLRVVNEEYLRATAWVAISNIVGDIATLSIDGDSNYPNLFTILQGPTTSGKTAHDKLASKAIRRAHKNPAIVGGNSSGTGLGDVLLGRDGAQTLLKVNEASGFIRSIGDDGGKGSWQSDLLDKITDYYDGKIEPKVRAGATQEEIKWVNSCFNMYLYATPERMMDALTKSMFESGFLMRVQWYIGTRRDLDEHEGGIQLTEYKRNEAAEAVLDEWEIRFHRVRESWGFKNGSDKMVWFESDKLAKWYQRLTYDMSKTVFAGHPDRDLLSASIERHGIAALKMATLICVADGRNKLSRDDLLVGIWMCEHSLTNLLAIFESVASSEHAKNLDKVETFILGHKSGAETWEVLRWGSERHGWTAREVDTFLTELTQQRRIKKERLSKDEYRYAGRA